MAIFQLNVIIAKNWGGGGGGKLECLLPPGPSPVHVDRTLVTKPISLWEFSISLYYSAWVNTILPVTMVQTILLCWKSYNLGQSLNNFWLGKSHVISVTEESLLCGEGLGTRLTCLT